MNDFEYAAGLIENLQALVKALEAGVPGGYLRLCSRAPTSTLVQGAALQIEDLLFRGKADFSNAGQPAVPHFCECGALKLGYKQREGHSSWCLYMKV